MRKRYLCLLAVMSLFLAVFVAAQQTGKALLEQGRTKKTAGDLQGAMEAFEKVIADSAATDRNATANALLEMGGIADSLGQLNRARNFYERVRTEFKDQAAEAAVASDRLKNQPTSPTSSAVGATAGATPSRSNEGPAKVTIRTPYTEDVYSFTISPDGRTLVFQGTSLEGKRQLWRQAVDPSSKAEPITGTEGAGASAFPFFSPDGKSVVFFAKQKFWQVDLAGGVAKEVTDAASSWGGTWAGDSMIISARGIGGPLERVQNGKLSAVTSVSGFFVGPHFLDERRFMYFSRDNRGSGTIEVGSLDGSTSTPRGLPAVQAASYTNGYVVFATPAGNLNAMRFDAKELTTSGGSFVLADRVGVERRYPGLGTLSTSASGAVAYRESAVANRQMMWMDRNGELVGTIGGADSASPGNPRVSPDGQVILFFRQTGSALGSVWVMDAQSRVQRQIQDGANTAIWSPTGDRILFAALRGGGARGGALGPLMIERPITAAAGSGAGTQVGPTTGVAFPEDWNPNGAVIYRTGLGAGAGGGDLFVVPPNNGSPVPVAQTLASERSGRFSPDGKWIAYQSDETGRNEVYVQPFPGTMGQRQRVSLNGGTSPQWGRKGRELYFISGDNKLMLAGASSGEFDTPKPLFKSPLPQGAEYDTVLDGDRFLILAPIEETPPIIVLNNWMR